VAGNREQSATSVLGTARVAAGLLPQGGKSPLKGSPLRQHPSGSVLQVHGSGSLVRWLLDNHLVDEIILLTYPVVIGQGTRLFPDTGPDTALDLVDSRAHPEGVTIHVYRPTGRQEYEPATV
jgi:dihydrofolate reductase